MIAGFQKLVNVNKYFFKRLHSAQRKGSIIHVCYNCAMKVDLALDIGGTYMRAAIFPQNQTEPTHQKRIRTSAIGETSFDRLLKLISDVCPSKSNIHAVGIGITGLVDPETGTVLTAPNLEDWIGVPIARRIEEKIGAPTFLGNDANLAALGEWHFGAGQGHQNLVYLTISTGIGAGVICHGRLLKGKDGLAGEFGHVTVVPDGPMCSCGHRGHLEALSSGTAIKAFFISQLAEGRESKLSGEPDAAQISQAANEGDPLAKEAFKRAGHYLGLIIANILMVFNPSIIILGGGVSQAGDLLFDPVRKTVTESVLSEEYLEDLIITQAALGDDAGLYGALVLARQKLSQHKDF
jgi:glucokinase